MLDPDTLIQQYLEGTLSGVGAGQLHELLGAQPELGEKLLQHLEMDAMLRATKPPVSHPIIGPAARPKPRFTLVSVAAVTALAACITLLAAWILLPGLKSDEENTNTFVAVFKRGVDLEWESVAITPGMPLSPGLLKLKSGIAQIEFYQGARVAIEGPAEFQLVSSGEATCTLGKLSAQVPPQAVGFRINTPKGSIVDLGTEFGIDVNANRSEVHVFKGEVALHRDRQAVELLKAGQAMSYASDLERLTSNPSKFASLNEINARKDVSDRARFKRWQAQSAQMKSDPGLRIHFDFQDDPTARSLRNRAPQGEDGSMVGIAWTEGRWPGKRALDFRNVSDRVRLSIPGETQALTMAVSVRVNGFNLPFNSLMMSDGWGYHKIHWQILSDGKIRLALAVPSDKGAGDAYDTPVYFTPERFGSWVHLSVVVDPAAKEVRHYANGTLLARLPLEGSSPLKIGYAELGNWNKVNNKSNVNICHLNGAVDEFALWDRALDDAEIAAFAK